MKLGENSLDQNAKEDRSKGKLWKETKKGVEIVGGNDPKWLKCDSSGYFRLIKVEERFYRARVKETKWWCKFSRKLDVPLSSSRGESGAEVEEGWRRGWLKRRSRWLKTLTRLTGFIARRRAAGSWVREGWRKESAALILIKIWPGSS